MKSLLISGTYFPPRAGGISHLMGGIASGLGPDLVCCLTGRRADHGFTGNGLTAKVYRRPAVFTARTKYLRAAAWAGAIAEIMVRERPKIVQIATAGEGVMGSWMRRWLALPYVVYAHGNEVLLSLQGSRKKSRRALLEADRVLAVSRFTADLVEKIGVPPSRIEIVHPGCDSEHFRPLPSRLDLRQKLLGERYKDKIILTVGGLVARKGHDMVIRALPHLLRTVPDASYLIVGRGRCRAELEQLATALGVRDRVIFAGGVSNDDLPHVFALSDVFVMPSRQELKAVEGFGLVFLEAAACGKPVVGGRSGGIPDAIVDGVTGFLVHPTDHEDIARGLARLLTDEELATRLGQQGRRRVVEEFAWGRVASRVQEILQSVRGEMSHGLFRSPISLGGKSLSKTRELDG
jgi:phosphatidylinositol alpha-1,6-mannosyltransferase